MLSRRVEHARKPISLRIEGTSPDFVQQGNDTVAQGLRYRSRIVFSRVIRPKRGPIVARIHNPPQPRYLSPRRSSGF